MLFPFLVILPGLIAISVPTVSQRMMAQVQTAPAPGTAPGATAVSSDASSIPVGRGLIPVKIDPVNGRVLTDNKGKPLLDYDLATPNMLLHFFPTGMLGLGLTALLASFMSGMAGNVTAFNTVWTYDIYQSYIHKNGTDAHYLWMGRMATIGGVALSIGAAYFVTSFNNIMDALQIVFSFVNAPLLATFLLGMFWKRTTGHGAFWGLLSGTCAAALHTGLTLPADVAGVGIHGGWIAVLHVYPSTMAQTFWTAIWAFGVCLVMTVGLSLLTKPREEKDLVGLVYSLTPKPAEGHLLWYQRPASLAILVLAMVVVLNLVFL